MSQFETSQTHGVQPDRDPDPNGGLSLDSRHLLLLGCAVFVLGADQIIKYLVVQSLQNGRSIEIAHGLVRLDFTRNTGAAFGMFQSGGWLFAAVAAIVSAGILIFFHRIAESSPLVRAGLGLILGGAIGNLADRIRLGYVVDYVDLRWWYVFNLADSAIVIGAGLLVLHSALSERQSRHV